MKVVSLDSISSTNTWLSEQAQSLDGPALVYAREQTAGRGQRGNSWEAEPGKNLTASILLLPEGISAGEQFVISEAVALAVSDLLKELGVKTKVKWPNDIYFENRKICGILIEHSIMGRNIIRTIAGIGINLNQTVFRSDAPNPVSVMQITGEPTDIASAANTLAEKIERRMELASSSPESIHTEFHQRLWRGDGGFYPFIDHKSGEHFSARISRIAPDGFLYLEDESGSVRSYAFKEVEFCLPE